ncbi:MAG TPA: acyl-CoA dehydrogenase family protein [Burkholderiales bacterium]|nr:acyl-CoA dehydrogenase family protein [Burkholderiales bacterium]
MSAKPQAHAGDEQETLILESVERFLERDVRPVVHVLEAADTYPAAMVEKLQALGLFGATIAPEFGGLGLPAVTYARIVERMSAVWMSVPGFFNSHLIMAAAVERHGTDEQKRRFLPRFASGELRGGIALTEPDCGSDLQAIRTHARREADHYIVNGAKTWITNSAEGGILAVLVKTDPRAQPPHKGMSLLLIEKGPGFKVVRKLDKLGYRGIDTAELLFEDCRVPAANLIGTAEGRGLQQVLAGLELGRINVAARGAGLARACLDESLRYAQQRRTFGKPIAEHQAIQIKLADMATRVEAARLLVEHAARAYDAGGRCDLEAGMAKLYATEAALENSLEAMRIHGAYGYSKEFNIERYYRDAPLLAIGEGTNELQRIIIARELVKRHPA